MQLIEWIFFCLGVDERHHIHAMETTVSMHLGDEIFLHIGFNVNRLDKIFSNVIHELVYHHPTNHLHDCRLVTST